MAKNSNFFDGEGYDRLMARSVYDTLRSGDSCSYSDFMEAYRGKPIEPGRSLSKDELYGSLKKAVGYVVNEICRVMGEDSILVSGNLRNRTYRYMGGDPDPLRLLRDSVPKGISEYLEFCRDSAGFIPEEWLLHFLKDSIALHDIYWAKENAKSGVLMTHSRELKNIEKLPLIYEAIKNKTILRIEYSPFEDESRVVWLSPHCLREFNGRWYVSGFVGRKGTTPYNLPLDRITAFEPKDGQYREAPMHLYSDWFNNLIGVARYEGASLENVVIRTYSRYVHGLLKTKPFHHSQNEISPYGQHPDGTYGEIGLKVLLNPPGKNKEFRGKILTFGKELEVISPQKFREEIANEVKDMLQSYL